jgi:hypothetical protein
MPGIVQGETPQPCSKLAKVHPAEIDIALGVAADPLYFIIGRRPPYLRRRAHHDNVYDMFGDRISFWGTIGTQQLLPFGTREEVKKVALSRLEKCGPKGGIVIGPTHIVEPEVPWGNLTAIVDAANEYKLKIMSGK